MNVKPIFEQNEIPTLEEYLRRCGIDDPEEYINANWVENYIVYDNIKDGVEILHNAITSDGKIILSMIMRQIHKHHSHHIYIM